MQEAVGPLIEVQEMQSQYEVSQQLFADMSLSTTNEASTAPRNKRQRKLVATQAIQGAAVR